MRQYTIIFKNASHESRMKVKNILESSNEQIYKDTSSFMKENDNKEYPYFKYTDYPGIWSGARSTKKSDVVISIEDFLALFYKTRRRKPTSDNYHCMVQQDPQKNSDDRRFNRI